MLANRTFDEFVHKNIEGFKTNPDYSNNGDE